MKDKVLLILFKNRMSARTLHSWADLNLWDDFFPDRMTELSQFITEFLAAGYIEIVEYKDDMFGEKNEWLQGYFTWRASFKRTKATLKFQSEK